MAGRVATAEELERQERVGREVWRWGAVASSLAALVYFYIFFDESRWQPSVDFAWYFAVAAWLFALWRPETASAEPLKHPLWFYALYAICLLPYSTNWRWAMTGDTLTWLFMGVDVADRGLHKSTLSAYGPDQFGYLQMLIHNAFMILVKPTIFWHRVGKIMVAVVAAAAIYTVFARLVRPAFGLLVTACTVSCSVWIVYTHSPFPYYDGIAGAFALLSIALWIRRDPESRRAWLSLGALSGFMLFLTMNGWFMAALVWSWMGLLLVLRRVPLRLFLLAVVTGAVVGGPMVFQWLFGNGGNQFDLVHSPAWTAEKVTRFFTEAALMPFQSELYTNGAYGPQLPFPFRWLFVPGLVIGLFFYRRYPGAGLMLWVYVVHLVGLVFSQGPYDSVSPKRALFLIPIATYFVFLPFHRWIRSLWVVIPIVLLWAAYGIHQIATRTAPGVVGYTLLDGVVEAHQRFSDASSVCIYLAEGDGRRETMKPGFLLDRLYALAPHVIAVGDPEDPACREVICYCSHPDYPQVDLAARGYTPIPMLNSNELRCGRRGAAIASGP